MNRASCWKRHAALAAIVAAPVLATGPVAVAQPKPPPAVAGDTQKATAYYLKGSELFKEKKFTQALEQFKLSYQTVRSPNSHLYIARCLAALGETQRAWLEFDSVVEEASARAATEAKYAPTRDSAVTERDEITPKIALVTVSVPHAAPGTTVRIGALDVPSEHWGRAYPLDPGTYEVKLDSPGKPPVRMPLTVGRGEQRPLTLDVGGGGPVAGGPRTGPAPTASKTNPLRIAGFVTAGVGVAGFVMFAVGGAMSKSTYSDLTTQCGGDTGGCHGKNVSDEISKGKTQQAIGNAGLIIGAVGVAAGAAMIAVSFRGKKDAGRPAAELVVKPTWVGLEGSF